ncbi:MAG: tryptophan--tRNA ligase [Candidatus Doudnabacteria bacterium]|nr:tryptophan--tRNA ligase [Candidatus Doudnabacteria bacterium]
MKETILSGIRASGKLHIGNYLGALKQFIELQDKYGRNCYFFIADLHAITTPFKFDEVSEDTIQVAADYLAAGIDPEKSTFFLQSYVPAHTQLAWIFESITPLGELYRMTQFKEKSEGIKNESVNTGLLTYPVLMAADILLYKPTLVPVGEDQTQHLELTRKIARKFNNKFGKTFPEPKNYALKPLRIMSLTDPTKKMSKTGDEALMLDDPPDEILRKLKKAVTATDTKQGSPGVDNLKFLLEQFGATAQVKDFSKYNELKETLAKTIADYFADFRAKKKTLLSKPDQIHEILAEGAKKASKVASQTLAEVKQKIGLI